MDVDDRLDASFFTEVTLSGNSVTINPKLLQDIERYTQCLSWGNAEAHVRKIYLQQGAPENITLEFATKMWKLCVGKATASAIHQIETAVRQSEFGNVLSYHELDHLILTNGIMDTRQLLEPLTRAQLADVRPWEVAPKQKNGNGNASSQNKDKDSASSSSPSTLDLPGGDRDRDPSPSSSAKKTPGNGKSQKEGLAFGMKLSEPAHDLGVNTSSKKTTDGPKHGAKETAAISGKTHNHTNSSSSNKGGVDDRENRGVSMAAGLFGIAEDSNDKNDLVHDKKHVPQIVSSPKNSNSLKDRDRDSSLLDRRRQAAASGHNTGLSLNLSQQPDANDAKTKLKERERERIAEHELKIKLQQQQLELAEEAKLHAHQRLQTEHAPLAHGANGKYSHQRSSGYGSVSGYGGTSPTGRRTSMYGPQANVSGIFQASPDISPVIQAMPSISAVVDLNEANSHSHSHSHGSLNDMSMSSQERATGLIKGVSFSGDTNVNNYGGSHNTLKKRRASSFVQQNKDHIKQLEAAKALAKDKNIPVHIAAKRLQAEEAKAKLAHRALVLRAAAGDHASQFSSNGNGSGSGTPEAEGGYMSGSVMEGEFSDLQHVQEHGDSSDESYSDSEGEGEGNSSDEEQQHGNGNTVDVPEPERYNQQRSGSGSGSGSGYPHNVRDPDDGPSDERKSSDDHKHKRKKNKKKGPGRMTMMDMMVPGAYRPDGGNSQQHTKKTAANQQALEQRERKRKEHEAAEMRRKIEEKEKLVVLDFANYSMETLDLGSISQLQPSLAVPNPFESILVLILRANKLFDMFPIGLHRLTHLTDLDLGSNKFLGPIPRNCIPPTVERLDLSYNQITDVSALLECPHLSILNVQNNSLKSVGNLPARLSVLDVSFNQVDKMIGLRMLTLSPCLKTLSVAGNPLAHERTDLRAVLASMLPSVVTLDGTVQPGKRIRKTENQGLNRLAPHAAKDKISFVTSSRSNTAHKKGTDQYVPLIPLPGSPQAKERAHVTRSFSPSRALRETASSSSKKMSAKEMAVRGLLSQPYLSSNSKNKKSPRSGGPESGSGSGDGPTRDTPDGAGANSNLDDHNHNEDEEHYDVPTTRQQQIDHDRLRSKRLMAKDAALEELRKEENDKKDREVDAYKKIIRAADVPSLITRLTSTAGGTYSSSQRRDFHQQFVKSAAGKSLYSPRTYKTANNASRSGGRGLNNSSLNKNGLNSSFGQGHYAHHSQDQGHSHSHLSVNGAGAYADDYSYSYSGSTMRSAAVPDGMGNGNGNGSGSPTASSGMRKTVSVEQKATDDLKEWVQNRSVELGRTSAVATLLFGLTSHTNAQYAHHQGDGSTRDADASERSTAALIQFLDSLRGVSFLRSIELPIPVEDALGVFTAEAANADKSGGKGRKLLAQAAGVIEKMAMLGACLLDLEMLVEEILDEVEQVKAQNGPSSRHFNPLDPSSDTYKKLRDGVEDVMSGSNGMQVNARVFASFNCDYKYINPSAHSPQRVMRDNSPKRAQAQNQNQQIQSRSLERASSPSEVSRTTGKSQTFGNNRNNQANNAKQSESQSQSAYERAHERHDSANSNSHPHPHVNDIQKKKQSKIKSGSLNQKQNQNQPSKKMDETDVKSSMGDLKQRLQMKALAKAGVQQGLQRQTNSNSNSHVTNSDHSSPSSARDRDSPFAPISSTSENHHQQQQRGRDSIDSVSIPTSSSLYPNANATGPGSGSVITGTGTTGTGEEGSYSGSYSSIKPVILDSMGLAEATKDLSQKLDELLVTTSSNHSSRAASPNRGIGGIGNEGGDNNDNENDIDNDIDGLALDGVAQMETIVNTAFNSTAAKAKAAANRVDVAVELLNSAEVDLSRADVGKIDTHDGQSDDEHAFTATASTSQGQKQNQNQNQNQGQNQATKNGHNNHMGSGDVPAFGFFDSFDPNPSSSASAQKDAADGAWGATAESEVVTVNMNANDAANASEDHANHAEGGGLGSNHKKHGHKHNHHKAKKHHPEPTPPPTGNSSSSFSSSSLEQQQVHQPSAVATTATSSEKDDAFTPSPVKDPLMDPLQSAPSPSSPYKAASALGAGDESPSKKMTAKERIRARMDAAKKEKEGK